MSRALVLLTQLTTAKQLIISSMIFLLIPRLKHQNDVCLLQKKRFCKLVDNDAGSDGDVHGVLRP